MNDLIDVSNIFYQKKLIGSLMGTDLRVTTRQLGANTTGVQKCIECII